jgi:hypothetical protein
MSEGGFEAISILFARGLWLLGPYPFRKFQDQEIELRAQ